jgi:hypothetical protein
MGMLICVDPTAYSAASQIFGEFLATAIDKVSQDLQRALTQGTHMAGHDPAGTAWGESYDRSAGQAVQIIDDLRRAALNVGALLQASGFNHARAEAYSDVSGGAELPPERLTYDPGFGSCIETPSCLGGGLPAPPDGWELVSSAIGAVWPDGDAAKLRAASHAWTTAADDLESCWPLVSQGISALDEQVSPEIEQARVVCRTLGDAITDIAAHCRTIAESTAEQADHIDKAHNDLRDELVQFLGLTLAIEGAAIAAGFFTAGIGTVAGQAGEVAEAANALTRMTLILARLLEAASLTGGRMAAGALDGVGDGLKAILAKTPTIAEVAPVASALKALELTADRLARSPWPAGPSPRGFTIEARLGGNLPAGFPTIDKFDDVTGVATSIKSVDLASKTYQDPRRLARLLEGYVDKVAGFRGAVRQGRIIDEFDILARQLEIAVPRGALPVQKEVLEEMSKYARSRSVELIVRVVR